MSSYESRITHYISGKTEEEVRVQLVEIGFQLGQKVEVINVYYNSGQGRVIAWYFHDTKTNAPLPKTEKKVSKKKTRKVK